MINTNNPQQYFRDLQAIANQQDRTSLKQLLSEYRVTLTHFPKIKTEITALLYVADLADYQPALLQAQEGLNAASQFLQLLEQLPVELQAQRTIQKLVQWSHAQASLNNVVQLPIKLNQVCSALREQARLRKQRELHVQKMRVQKAQEKLLIAQAKPVVVHIPAGHFMMGCVEFRDGSGQKSEKPAHFVKLNAFSMGQYPVTFQQYDAYCKLTDKPLLDDRGWGRGAHPVIYVSWDDAQVYLQWLTQYFGHYYRLPTEAEWEYAARANSQSMYPWGVSCHQQYANYGGHIGKTSEVAQYPPNAFDLYDMQGNVWEWCQDVWNDDYSQYENKIKPWAEAEVVRRVVRGGSWFSPEEHLRCAYRYPNNSNTRSGSLGFRVVCHKS